MQQRKEDNSRYLRVRMLLRARYSDANVALQYFHQNQEEDPFLRAMGQAIASERLNQIAKAQEAFDQAQALRPDDPLLIRELGIFHYKHGHFDEAGMYLQKALFQAPNDLMALFFYARLLTEQGQPGQAAEYFQRILRHLPEDAEVHYYHGRALGQDRRYFEAHLHLALAALYSRDLKQLRFHSEKAKSLAVSPEQRKRYEDLEAQHKERKEFW